jgi:hypothetical protein
MEKSSVASHAARRSSSSNERTKSNKRTALAKGAEVSSHHSRNGAGMSSRVWKRVFDTGAPATTLELPTVTNPWV